MSRVEDVNADTDAGAGATAPELRPEVAEYHEVTAEGVTEVTLQLRGAEREVSLAATQTGDGPLEVQMLNDKSTTVLERTAFGLFRAGVDELRRRGFEPDMGCLQFGRERGPETAKDGAICTECGESHDDGACWDEDDPTDGDGDGDGDGDVEQEGDPDEQWCGICGDGPYSSLNIHHGRTDDGEPVPLSHEPTADELVGEGVGEDVDDSEDVDEETDGTTEGEQSDTVDDSAREDWMPADPHDLVDESAIRRPPDEFLTAIEVENSIVEVMRRVAATNSDQVREVARDLGLTNGHGQLLEDDVLQERIETIREVTEADG